MSYVPHTRLHVTLELVMDRYDDEPAAPALALALREWMVQRENLEDAGHGGPYGPFITEGCTSNDIRVRESYSLSWPWPLSPAA